MTIRTRHLPDLDKKERKDFPSLFTCTTVGAAGWEFPGLTGTGSGL